MYSWRGWDLASTFIYATGRPFTEVLGVVDDTFPATYEVGDKNDERYEAYHRLDLSATYNFQLLGGEGQADCLSSMSMAGKTNGTQSTIS